MHPQAYAYHQAGLRFHQEGDLLPAVREYLRALALDPTMELTRQNLAALYLRLGETEKAIEQYLQLLELNPLSTKAYFNLGTLYSSHQRWKEASEQFERLLTLEGEHLPALTNLGWIYRRQGEMERAIEVIEKANQLDPGNPKIQVQLGRLYLDEERKEEALKLFQEAHAKDPHNTATLVALADCAWGEGMAGETLKWAQEALLYDPEEPRAKELALWCHRMFADEAREAENDEAQAQHLEGILTLDPENIDPLDELRTLYQKSGDLAKLCRILELMNQKRPAAGTALLLGECLLKCGKPQEAKEVFRNLTAKTPNLAALTRLFTLSKGDASDTRELLTLAHQIVELDPSHLEAQLALAEDAARHQRHQEAVLHVQKILALDPKNLRALELMVLSYRALAKAATSPKEASKHWNELLKRKPDDTEALLQLGSLCFEQERYPDAAKHYKRLLALNPKDTEIAYTLAIIYRNMGVQAGAIAILNAILERHPHVGAKITLAELEPAQAREHLNKALEWNPQSSEALVALGNLEWQEGHPQKAWSLAQEAIEINRTDNALQLGKTCLKRFTAEALAGEPELALQLVLRLLDLDPLDTASMRLMGRICRRKGISAKAAEAFSGILSITPTDLGALHGLYRAYRQMNLPTQARQLLRQGLKEKKSTRLFKLLIDSFLEENNLYGALENAEEFYAWQPEHPVAKEILANCCRKMAQHAVEKKDYPIAAYYWERLRTVLPGDPEAIRHLAGLYLKAQDYKHALPLFEELLAQEPKNRQLLVNLGWLCQQLQRSNDAIPYYERALVEEDDPKLRLVLAQLYRQAGDPLKAQGAYLEIIQKTPDHLPSHQALAELSWEQGSYVECHYHARELLRRRPNDPRGRELAIGCLLELAKVAKSARDRIPLYEDLREFLPQDPATLEKLAEAYQEAGDIEKAISCYERLVQITPRNRRTLFLLGECLAKAGNMERAKEVLSALDRAEPHLGAIETLAMRCHGEDAVPYLWRLLTFVPEHIEALIKLGGLLVPVEGIPVLEKACELSPENPKAKQALIDALEQMALLNSASIAEEYWRRILKLQPSHLLALKRLSQFLQERDLGQAEPLLEQLVKMGEAEPDSVLLLAKQWLAKGRRDEALALLRGIAAGHGEAAKLLAGIAQEDEDFNQAESYYLQAEALDPEDQSIHLKLGELYHERGRYQDALAQLEPLGTPAAQDLLLECLHQLAKGGDDEAILKEILLREPANIEAKLRLGTLLFEGGRYAEALPLLDPHSQGLMVGEALQNLDRLDEAKECYEEMLRHDGRRQDLKLLLCEIAIDQGDDTPPKLPKVLSNKERDIAIRCFRKLARKVAKPRRYWHRILDLAPDDMEALKALSKIYLASEDFGAAKSLLERLNQLAGDPEVRYDLATAHLGLHEREIAKRVLAPSRQDLLSLLLLAKLHEEDEEPEAEGLYERVLTLADNNEAHSALGRLAFERKDYRKALSHLAGIPGTELTQAECHRQLALTEEPESHWRSLLALAPKDREGRRQLGQLLYQHDEFEEALKVLEPTRQGLLILDCYRKLDRLADAMEACEGMLTSAPGDKDLAIALSEVAAETGNHQKALEIVERVIALDRNHAQARKLALRYLDNLVKQAKTHGDSQSATRALEKLRILIPERDILKHLGQAYQTLGLLEKALGILEPLLKEDPTDRDIALLAGECHYKQGNNRRAKVLFNQIIQENPQHLPAQMALAEIALKEGEEQEALEHLERVLARKPGHREATDLAIQCLRELAHQAYAKNDPEQATLYWEQLSKLDAEDTEALFELGRLYFDADKPEKAAPKLRRILENDFDADTAYRLAKCLQTLGDENEARIWLEQIANAHMEASLALVELAKTPEEEIQRLQETLEVSPDHEPSRIRLAKLLLNAENPDQALTLIDDLDPLLAAECHRKMARRGDPEEWNRVLDYLPDDLEALQAIAFGHLKDGAQLKAAEVLEHISQLRQDPILFQEQGDLWMRLGELEQATAAYEQALVLSPNHLPSKFGMAKMYWETENLAEAWKLLEEILQKRPNYPEAQALAYRCLDKLAQEAINIGDFESASYFIQSQLAQRPDQPELIRKLAHCQEKAHNFEEALETYQTLIGRDEADFDAFIGIGRCHYGLGNLEEARQELQRLLVFKPDLLEGLVLAGELAAKLRRYDEAIDLYQQARALDPNNPDYSVVLAELAIKGNDTHSALEILNSVMEEHPEHEQAQKVYISCLHQLAKEAHENGVPELAIAFTRKILDNSPDDSVALQRLTQLLVEKEDPEEALETFQRAIALHPDNPDLVAQMAELLIRLGRTDEAKALLLQNLEQNPRHSNSYAVLAQLSLDDPLKARDYAKQALEYKPKHRQAKQSLIEASRRLANETGELEYWKELLQLAPKDAEALLAISRSLVEDAPEDALDYLGRLLKSHPGHPDGLYLQARCSLDLNQEGKAEKCAQKLLKHDAESAHGHLILALLAHQRGNENNFAKHLGYAQTGEHDPETLVVLGKLALVDHRPEEALSNAEQALAVSSNAVAINLAINAHLALAPEDPHHYQAILDLAPSHLEALEGMARFLYDQEDARCVSLCRQYLAQQQNPEIATMLAKTLLREGNTDEALEILETATRETPYLPALLTLGEQLRLQGKQEEAKHAFERAVEVDPFQVSAHLALGEIAYQSGEITSAWLEVERVLAVDPTDDSARVLAVQIAQHFADEARQRGDASGAIGYLKRIIELEPQQIEARIQLAEAHLEAEQYQQTIELCQELMAMGQEEPELLSLWGQALEGLSRMDEAAIAYERVLEHNSQHVPTLFHLAQLCWKSQHLDRAWELVDNLLSAEPKHIEGQALQIDIAKELGASAFRRGEYTDALTWWQFCYQSADLGLLRQMAQAYVAINDFSTANRLYRQLLDLDPDDLETSRLIADLYLRQGDLNRAEKQLRELLAKNPRQPESLLAMARIAQHKGQAQEAMNQAFNVLDLDPQQPDALAIQGWAHKELLEFRAAIDIFEQLAALQPQNPEPQHELALLYYENGQPEAARKAVSTAIYHSPKNPVYFNTLGRIYTQMRQWDEAEASFSFALQLNPDYGDAYANLGFAMIQAGQKTKARPYLEQASHLIPQESEMALSVRCALDLF